jgi:hypothetical protein
MDLAYDIFRISPNSLTKSVSFWSLGKRSIIRLSKVVFPEPKKPVIRYSPVSADMTYILSSLRSVGSASRRPVRQVWKFQEV